MGTEGSGRIRPVDLALDLLKDAKATTSAVIPRAQQPTAPQDVSLPLISAGDLGAGFVLDDESSLSNEDRSASYDNPDDALAFYEKYGRVGGVRRVFDDFDAADSAGTIPSLIVVQGDVYDTAEGAAGAVSGCDEYLDTIWEYVTVTGLQFYEPNPISDPRIGDEDCLYSAKEIVASSGEPPVRAQLSWASGSPASSSSSA